MIGSKTLWFVGAGFSFILLLVASETAARRWRLRPEVGRKLAHISSGLLASALPVALTFPAIVTLAAIFVPFMLGSRRIGLFPLIHGAERTTYGEIYFPIGVLVVAAAVPHGVEYAFGVLVLAISDAAASLAGQRFGRRSFGPPWARKTYVGSGTFMAATLALATGGFAVLGPTTFVSLGLAVAVALGLTLLEAILGGGTDNVLLPISAATLLRVLA